MRALPAKLKFVNYGKLFPKKAIEALTGKGFRSAPEAEGMKAYYDELAGIYKNAVAGTFEKINEAANSGMSANNVDTSSQKMYNDKEQLSRKDKLIGKHFPFEDESGSDTNKYCTLWAKNPDVKTGDARLASYRGRWYIIEKFDSADFGYQIVERVLKSQLKEYRKDYEDVRNSKRKSVASSADGIDSRIGGRNQYSSGNRNVDSDVAGYRREDSTVRSLGTGQYTGGESLQSGLYDDRKNSERNKEGRRTSESEEVKTQLSRKMAEMEAEYLELAKNPEKNKNKLRKIVEYAAKAAGNKYFGWHGSNSGGFTVFDASKSDDSLSLFIANNKNMSRSYVEGYSDTIISPDGSDNQKGLYRVAVKMDKPYIINGKGRAWNNLGVKAVKKVMVYVYANEDGTFDLKVIKTNVKNGKRTIERFESVSDVGKVMPEYVPADLAEEIASAVINYDATTASSEDGGPVFHKAVQYDKYDNRVLTKTRQYAKYAKEHGYDGVIIKDIYDSGKYSQNRKAERGDIYIVFDGEQIKSLDPVTYDDERNIIPLSERFNEKNEDIRYSRKTGRSAFKSTIDRWNDEGRPDGVRLNVGMTGNILQGLGAIESDIYINSDKVNTILAEHTEMTLDIISKIPEILDDPALILKSNNAVGQTRSNTRVVMFGSVKAENGLPVLVVLDLRPFEKGLVVNDMQKVTSTYTKTNSPVDFVGNSEVLYADKKRTLSVLRTIGFQMPIELDRSGFIGSISYHGQNVNIKVAGSSEESCSHIRQQNAKRKACCNSENAARLAQNIYCY